MKNCLAALLCLLALPAVAETLVLAPVNVVYVTQGVIAPDMAVRVNDGEIIEVAEAAGMNTDGARIIDGQGGYLLAGLAEMHAHVPPMGDEQRVRDVLTLFLANGVTTIRGMLGEPGHLALRDALEQQQDWIGPRLITSGPSFNGNSVTSAEQAARRAREQAAAGYDFLKLHPGLELDEFLAIDEAADAAGIPYAGHVSQAVGLHRALRARQATIDHLDGYLQALVPEDHALHGAEPGFFGLNLAEAVDAQRIAVLVAETTDAGTWNVPTEALMVHIAGDMPVESLLARPAMRYVSDGLAQEWAGRVRDAREQVSAEQRRAFLGTRAALIVALQRGGAGLLLGSDAPQVMNVPGYSTHEELEIYVSAGLTPAQALATGTVNVARFFGENHRGQVAAGHRADLVLLSADPLQDIRNTRQILGVMRAGRWYDRAELDRMLAAVAERGL